MANQRACRPGALHLGVYSPLSTGSTPRPIRSLQRLRLPHFDLVLLRQRISGAYEPQLYKMAPPTSPNPPHVTRGANHQARCVVFTATKSTFPAAVANQTPDIELHAGTASSMGDLSFQPPHVACFCLPLVFYVFLSSSHVRRSVNTFISCCLLFALFGVSSFPLHHLQASRCRLFKTANNRTKSPPQTLFVSATATSLSSLCLGTMHCL